MSTPAEIKMGMKWMRRMVLAVLVLLAILAGGSQPVTAQPNGWSQPQYLNVSGTVFRPRSSLSTWNHLSNCLIVNSNPLKVFNVPVHLPQGARIDYLSFYYLDDDVMDDNSQAYLAIYDGHGGITDLASLYSQDALTNGITVSPYIGHIIDNASFSYVLSYRAVVEGGSMRLCSMQVVYRTPAENIFMPLLAR